MKKKILIFSGAYFPKHVGGAEVSVKEITDRLPRDRYEFHMVTNRFDSSLPKIEQVGNVLVHRIGITTKNPTMADLRKVPLHLNKLLYQYFAYRKAKQLHTEYHYDAIWAVMAHSTGVPAALFKKAFPEVKYILNLQEGDPPEYIENRMRIFGNLFRQAFLRADAIQSLSSFLQRWGRRMGFQGVCDVVIPNAVDFEHFAHEVPEEDINKQAHSLGKKKDDVFLVTTSRLVHKNAVDVVIDALPLLPPSIHFVVCGTGPDERTLRAQVRALGLEARVHFYGYVEHKDLPLLLRACDIFIRPSRSEGMGASFVEAMAAGLPVIATQEGGISDFLFDAKRNPDKPTTGWAVKSESPEDIVAAIQDITMYPEKAHEVALTAKQMVEKTYNWDLVARRMETEVFKKILGAGSK